MIKERFNENWVYSLGSGTALEKTIHGDTEKKKVTLPHDAMIHQLRDRNAAAGNAFGYYPCISASYEKIFAVNDLNGSAYLEFEGIYKDASVYLNGSLLKNHHNGYLPLMIDVSSLLKKGDNSIRVLCRNSLFPESPYAEQAYREMSELYDKLALKELKSAQLYYNLGSYLGNNYLSCEIVCKNALKNFPSNQYQEEFNWLILQSKYQQVVNSFEELKQERARDAQDEYYNFITEYPESKHRKEADKMLITIRKIIKD